MARRDRNVKPRSRQLADWIDCHPRTGWYAAIWAALVTLNVLIGYVDALLHALT